MNFNKTAQLDDVIGRQFGDDGAGGEPGAIDLRKVISFVWRAKWKILIGALCGAVIAMLINTSAVPLYTARTTVLFTPEQRNVVDIEGVLQAANDQSALGNQLEILRSTSLLDRVVESMRLWTVPDFNPSLITERGRLDEIKRWLNWRTYVTPDLLANLGVIEAPTPPSALPADVILQREKRGARGILAARMTLTPVPRTRALRIAVTTRSPTLSADVANAVAREYITAQLDNKLATTREAARWLSDRVIELEAEVSAAEAEVSAYTNELVGRSGQTSALLRQQLEALNEALSVATARQVQANARFQRASSAVNDTAAIGIVSEFQTSELVNAARARERSLLTERAELLRLVSENHERVQLLDARIVAAQADIRAEAARIVRTLESEMRSAESEANDLRAEVQAIEQSLIEQQRDEVSLRQLEREAEASRLIYENFLGRLKEITQQQELEEADAVILSPAEVPGGADAQSAKRIMALSLILGSGFGLGLAWLLDRLNNTFRSVEEVQSTTGLTVLGVLPSVGRQISRKGVLTAVREKPSDALPEAMRGLRTSLLFSNLDNPPQVIMITSSVPGEGKSTTGLLLAITSAQMGKSAIIVDCDLRRPSLHAFFGDKAQHNDGMRGVLEGSIGLDEAILVDHNTGLTVLPSRVQDSAVINAADVLSSDRFGELIEYLRGRYELVILDTPPVLAVTDAQIIAKRVDTALYCVKWDNTPREVVLEGMRNFQIVYPDIAGIAITMVDGERAASYGYKYGGYYGRYNNPYLGAG